MDIRDIYVISGMKDDGQRTQNTQHHMPLEPTWQHTYFLEYPDALAQRVKQQDQHHQAPREAKVIAKIKQFFARSEKCLRVEQEIAPNSDCPYKADEC